MKQVRKKVLEGESSALKLYYVSEDKKLRIRTLFSQCVVSATKRFKS